jgi:hypothetical protein
LNCIVTFVFIIILIEKTTASSEPTMRRVLKAASLMVGPVSLPVYLTVEGLYRLFYFIDDR